MKALFKANYRQARVIHKEELSPDIDSYLMALANECLFNREMAASVLPVKGRLAIKKLVARLERL